MPLILVVAPEPRLAERVAPLADDGWRIERATDMTTAMEATAAEPPDLFLVSASAEGAGELLGPLARRRGGPGTIAVRAAAAGGGRPADDPALELADVVLEPGFDLATLREALSRVLADPGRPRGAAGEDKLTSEDIFGDMVAELELEEAEEEAPSPPAPVEARAPEPPPAHAEAHAPGPPPAPEPAAPPERPASPPEPPEPSEPPAAAAAPAPAAPVTPAAPAAPSSPPRRPAPSLDERLEKTLAGLFDDRRAPAPKRPAGRPASRPAAGGNADVDALLGRTLAGLDLPRRPKARPAGAPTPVETTPAETAGEAPQPTPAAPSAPPPPAEPPPAEPPPAASDRSATFPDPPPAPPVSPAPPSTEEGTPFGQYRLLDRIGVGGMAEVWKARMQGMEGFQKTVAIKKILPHLTDSSEFVDMFVDEAKLAAQLNHPNIIHIYDLGKIDDAFYIAMEHVEGENLRTVLDRARRRHGALPPALALHVGGRLARALDHAHRRRDFDGRDLGLVHRDVSPQNVLISRDGDIKLCDFGIVKAVSKSSHTQMGALKGKLQYMSPEQAWGRTVDARSDIFGLGVLLFEMLSGERLFDGDSEVAILDAVREVRLRPLTGADGVRPAAEPAGGAETGAAEIEAIEAVVRRCLEAEPEDRFASAGELADRLDALAARYRPVPGPPEVAAYLAALTGPDAAEPPSFVYLGEPEPAETTAAATAPDAVAPPPPTPTAPAAPGETGEESPFLDDEPAPLGELPSSPFLEEPAPALDAAPAADGEQLSPLDLEPWEVDIQPEEVELAPPADERAAEEDDLLLSPAAAADPAGEAAPPAPSEDLVRDDALPLEPELLEPPAEAARADEEETEPPRTPPATAAGGAAAGPTVEPIAEEPALEPEPVAENETVPVEAATAREDAVPGAETKEEESVAGRRGRRTGLVAAAIVAILVLGALLVWIFVLRDGPGWRVGDPGEATDAPAAATAAPGPAAGTAPAEPEPDGPADAADAPGEADAAGPAAGPGAADIEALVDEELARREEELRQQFEEQLARDRRRLEELQRAAEEPPPPR